MTTPFDVMTATIFYFSVQGYSNASVVGAAKGGVGSSTGAVQMSHADQLIEIATELAMDAKDDVADLQRKLSAIETAKVEIKISAAPYCKPRAGAPQQLRVDAGK